MTNDQRVRFIAAILRRENGGKKTLEEQCGAEKWSQTREMPCKWSCLIYVGKENEYTGIMKKIKQELDFCSYSYHYFNNELNILQQEK